MLLGASALRDTERSAIHISSISLPAGVFGAPFAYGRIDFGLLNQLLGQRLDALGSNPSTDFRCWSGMFAERAVQAWTCRATPHQFDDGLAVDRDQLPDRLWGPLPPPAIDAPPWLKSPLKIRYLDLGGIQQGTTRRGRVGRNPCPLSRGKVTVTRRIVQGFSYNSKSLTDAAVGRRDKVTENWYRSLR